MNRLGETMLIALFAFTFAHAESFEETELPTAEPAVQAPPSQAPPSQTPVAADVPVGQAEIVVSESADPQVRTALAPHALQLSACYPSATQGVKSLGPPTGLLTLELRVRRGRAELVTVNAAEPVQGPMVSCLERELAQVEWPLRKGRLQVPLEVTEPPPPQAPTAD